MPHTTPQSLARRRMPSAATIASADFLRMSQDTVRLAIFLMAELGAFIETISEDIARGQDLEIARTRWRLHLNALAASLLPSSSPASSMPTPHASDPQPLTPRESEIIVLAQHGVPPKKIARQLQLSVQTVYTHLRNARHKLRVSDS